MSCPAARWRAHVHAVLALLALAWTPGVVLAEPLWQVRQDWPPGEATALRQVSAMVAADGSTTLALRRVGTPGTYVTRIDADGIRLWSVLATAPGLRVADCGESVCIAGSGQVGQLDAGTGAERWSLPRFDPVLGWEPLPGADGGLVLIERLGMPPGGFPVHVSAERVVSFSSTGETRYELVFGYQQGWGNIPGQLLGHDGSGTLAVHTGADESIALLHPDGRLAPVLASAPRRYATLQFQLAGVLGADGVVRYPGQTGPPPSGNDVLVGLVQARSGLDPAVTPLGMLPFPWGTFSGLRAFSEVLEAPGFASVLGLELRSEDPDAGSYLLQHVDDAGAPSWTRRWTTGVENRFRVLASGSSDVVVLSQRRDGQTVQRTVSPDGRLLRQIDLVCGERACPYDLAAALAADGDLQIAGQAGPDQDPHVLVSRWPAAPVPPPQIAVAQAGLEGAWFALYTGGQGYTLRLFPDDQGGATVFLPWFTFNLSGGSDRGNLRWYALQGDVAAGASEATLAIVERVGGVFATTPASPPVLVGQARLRFADCSNGLLDYRFDPEHNGGAEGTVALTPLLPRGAPCTQADGQVLPADASYDPALTGHWFDPDRSGQGLELARIAPGAQGEGLFYGAWFTFDPTPASDEPGDQHWFTVQGQENLSGGVRTTIVQTLGGRFDSAPAGAPFRVGEADLLPGPDCSALTLRYRFDDIDAAGAFQNRSGELQLRRLGACPAPPS